MAIDGLRFADIDGDGIDDYIWLGSDSGAPNVFFNKGVNVGDSLGWLWSEPNWGNPVASGAAPASQVAFGDIDGDGLDDYLDPDPKTVLLKAYLNNGMDPVSYRWSWNPNGTIASGLGPGKRVRIADIYGDGRDDYILLKDNGGTTIYRNVYSPDNDGNKYRAMPDADASGIGQSPDEIDFVDINGDGKADYVWTRKLDGRIAGGVGTSGANIRYARLQNTGRADYVPVDPKTGAIAAWLGGCGELSTTEKNHKVSIARGELGGKGNLTHAWILKQHPLDGSELKATDFCDFEGWQERPFSDTTPPPDYPIAIRDIPKLFDRQCFYGGNMNRIGQLVCDGKLAKSVNSPVLIREHPQGRQGNCGGRVASILLITAARLEVDIKFIVQRQSIALSIAFIASIRSCTVWQAQLRSGSETQMRVPSGAAHRWSVHSTLSGAGSIYNRPERDCDPPWQFSSAHIGFGESGHCSTSAKRTGVVGTLSSAATSATIANATNAIRHE
ncbi:hypothetical protein F4825DRAFT_449639 [Nemania diffusa]|nr:hypothetical protein F4825DRAFT_449639 [Nemania diffusa]